MILLMGYGSTLRGDDGIGQIIAGRFDGHLYGEAVQVMTCHQLTPELVEPVSRADLVIFVDASEEGLPGEIRCVEVTPEVATGAFTHNVSPATLLAAAADLYGVHRRGLVISITGTQFDFGERLSTQVESAVPDVMNLVSCVIEAVLSGVPWSSVTELV